MAMTSGGVRLVSVGAAVETGGYPETSRVAAALGAAGVPVSAHVVVDDDERALEAALDATGVVAIVAGFGGSSGDSVRRVLARITGGRLRLNERMRGALEAHYAKRDRPLPRSAERLALLPQGASVAEADAPVWVLETAKTSWVVFLRGGVSTAVDTVLTPLARVRLGARGPVAVRTFKTAGVSVEDLDERLLDRPVPREVSLVTVPGESEVWVHLRARGRTQTVADRRLAEAAGALGAVLGDDCYGHDGDTLEAVVGKLLQERHLMLAVAESCTGGLVGHRITSIAGSSAYFERGVMVYSNEAKQEMLGVDEAILRTHGAVSAQCAEAMARGICERSRTACGLSITGIAGPGGATPTKPVGTVFIGLAVQGDVVARRFRFDGDRASVKWQSSVMALDMLRRRLKAV
jgi:nicotinamide-nucleotide amidase